METLRFPAESLRLFASEVFRKAGVPDVDATQAADVLCTADEWGIESHGLARLSGYHAMLQSKRINSKAKPRIVKERPSVVVVDADNGLGLVVAPFANRIGIARAASSGSAWVSVFNSNHFGIAGYYVIQGLDGNVIGVAMTNTPPLVAPLWGAARMLGTNPLACAFPGLEEPPVVIDMSTSAISFGVVENARRSGSPVPHGCLVDGNGNLSTDPDDLFQGGSLLPLGGSRETGGHKGYCLSALIDLFCGPLCGAAWGPFVPPFLINSRECLRTVGKGTGHFFGAYSIAAFCDPLVFRRRVDDWVRTMRSTAAASHSEGPLVPGDPERISAEDSLRNGIKLSRAVINDLEHLGRVTRIPFG